MIQLSPCAPSIIPVCPYWANALLFGSGTHTAILHLFPVGSVATVNFESIELPIIRSPIQSFTNSPHSFPLFGLVVWESREGITALSGALSRAMPVTPLYSGVIRGAGSHPASLYSWYGVLVGASLPGSASRCTGWRRSSNNSCRHICILCG